MLRHNAGVEKRAFRIAVCDPRRSATCAAVRLQARFTAFVSRPLTVASAYHCPLTALQNLTKWYQKLSHKPAARFQLRASKASEPRDRSALAKRRARKRVAESEGEALG